MKLRLRSSSNQESTSTSRTQGNRRHSSDVERTGPANLLTPIDVATIARDTRRGGLDQVVVRVEPRFAVTARMRPPRGPTTARAQHTRGLRYTRPRVEPVPRLPEADDIGALVSHGYRHNRRPARPRVPACAQRLCEPRPVRCRTEPRPRRDRSARASRCPYRNHPRPRAGRAEAPSRRRPRRHDRAGPPRTSSAIGSNETTGQP